MNQFRKTLLSISIITGTTLLLSGYSSAAQAGYYKHGHGYYGGKAYHYGHRRHRYRNGYRRHRHSDRAAYLVGGLALGALISHAYHTPHRRYYRGHNDVYAVRESSRPTVIHREGRVTRSLFKDRDGNCFERKSEDGQELLIELPDRECAW
ncbi:MAG: hypothetical protein AAF541_00370 [Pseudomonadota bacterium]